MLGIDNKFCLSIKFYGPCQNIANIYVVDTPTELHYLVRLDEKQCLWLIYADRKKGFSLDASYCV